MIYCIEWIKEVRGVSDNSVIMIVGNKVDLRNNAFDKSNFVSKA